MLKFNLVDLKEMIGRARKKGILFLLGRGIILICALPFVLLIRLIRPVVCIRLCELNSYRIGHFAMNTELYLCKLDANKQNYKRTIDIFYFGDSICNQQLANMWKKSLRIWSVVKFIDKVNRIIPGSFPHTIPEIMTDVDPLGLVPRSRPHLSFTPQEEALGQKALREMGIGPNDTWVCFHCRDSEYLTTAYPSYDYTYHTYRDANINTYHPALIDIAKHGHYLVHMGKHVQRALDKPCDKLINYAQSTLRSDFLDIYLPSKCRYFISSNGGIDNIPKIFRRPIVFLNFITMADSSSSSSDFLLIHKKLWIKSEGRFMSFPEMINGPAGRFYRNEQYEKAGLEVINNTEEEIQAVVDEMEQRLNGTWKTTEEDEILQKKFWTLFNDPKNHEVKTARVGAAFLRENQSLLELPSRTNISVQQTMKG